jgi:hypothetical protein
VGAGFSDSLGSGKFSTSFRANSASSAKGGIAAVGLSSHDDHDNEDNEEIERVFDFGHEASTSTSFKDTGDAGLNSVTFADADNAGAVAVGSGAEEGGVHFKPNQKQQGKEKEAAAVAAAAAARKELLEASFDPVRPLRFTVACSMYFRYCFISRHLAAYASARGFHVSN